MDGGKAGFTLFPYSARLASVLMKVHLHVKENDEGASFWKGRNVQE